MNKNDKEVVQQDIQKYGALAALYNTEGGQVLIKTLNEDVLNLVDTIAFQYATLSETELRAKCAAIGLNLSMLRAMNRSNKNYADAVDFMATLTE
jgi:paraquat-inducible protein B